MGKRVSPAVIGAFVVASFAILIVAAVIVGSGRMFARPIRFICVFPGNLNGLKVGGPVKVRGVQIGTMAAIRLRLEPSEGRLRPDVKGLRLPVIVELDKSMLTSRGATGAALGGSGFQDWIQRGMRAQLEVESLCAALVGLQQTLDPIAPLAVRLNQALDSLAKTSRSIGELSEYLQRDPGALIRGRYVPEKGK
jgi:phospholipid/cholesterol/gamma-HCH transport system substrate-binding protein